jgi:hypothetical protein
MEETKQPKTAYSDEQLEILGPDSLRDSPAATESSAKEKTATKPTQTAQRVVARESSWSGATGTKVKSAEFPNGFRWDETGTQQSVAEQIRDPLRIFHVGLATRDLLYVLRVGDDDLTTVIWQLYLWPSHRRDNRARFAGCLHNRTLVI